MTIPAPLPFVLLLSAFLLIVLLVALRSMHRKVPESRCAVCPESGRKARLVILRDQSSHHIDDVIRCSELPAPDHVGCHKRCVQDLNLIRKLHLVPGKGQDEEPASRGPGASWQH